jgi:acetoin utilization deacetylase AcuC-like enzyme
VGKEIKAFTPTLLDKLTHHDASGKNFYKLDFVYKIGELNMILSNDSRFKLERVESEDEHLLNQVHSPEYLTALKTGTPLELAESSGIIWQEILYPAIVNTSYASFLVCKEAVNHKVSLGVFTGGHHAESDRGYGFNPANFIAVSATELLKQQQISRIAVLDLDIHYGNGTLSILGNNENVCIVDIWSESRDKWGKPKNPINGFQVQTTDLYSYFSYLSQGLIAIQKFKPDLLIYHSGMDVFQGDRLGGIHGFNETLIKKREEIVFQFVRSADIPIAVFLGGGYVRYDEQNKIDERRKKLVDLHRITIRSLYDVFNS